MLSLLERSTPPITPKYSQRLNWRNKVHLCYTRKFSGNELCNPNGPNRIFRNLGIDINILGRCQGRDQEPSLRQARDPSWDEPGPVPGTNRPFSVDFHSNIVILSHLSLGRLSQFIFVLGRSSRKGHQKNVCVLCVLDFLGPPAMVSELQTHPNMHSPV